MNPWDELAARIDLDPDDFNIYPAMVEQVLTPAVIITPNQPWIQSTGFQYDTERYLVTALVLASAPADGLEQMHTMMHAIRESGGDGWEIGDISGVRNITLPDDGTRYLGVQAEVTFRNCDHAIEEGS